MEFEVRVHSAAPDISVPMNMRMTKRSHTLPALTTQRGSSAIRQVPKRYEDTRPAKVQDFSHQRILSLGLDVHHRLQLEAETQREEAVRETEARVWKEAQEQKMAALADLQRQMTLQADQQLQRIKRQHQKELQEKLLEMETALEQENRAALEQEKEAARIRQEAAIAENDAYWKGVVAQEVATARREEQQKAAAEKAELRRKHEAELRTQQQRALADKAAALDALERRKNSEAAIAVSEARAEERSISDSRVAVLQEQHESAILELKGEIIAQEERAALLGLEIIQVQAAKDEVEEALLEERMRFKELVQRVFQEDARFGQTEFLDLESEAVLAILNERGVEPAQLRGPEWRPHSPDGTGAGVGSVKLVATKLKSNFRMDNDFL